MYLAIFFPDGLSYTIKKKIFYEIVLYSIVIV